MDLRILVSLNRRFTCMVGVANVKTPRLLAFARHVETAIIKAQKLRSATLMRSRTLLVTTILWRIWRRTRLVMPKTICTLDSSSLKPGSGATEGVLDWGGGPRTAELYPLAGLLDYEDTRLKTSTRVRMGLSLAWKASLAIRICRSPPL